MGTKHLLDTNVIIDYSSQKLSIKAHKKLSLILDNYPAISVINKIELLGLSVVPNQIIVFTNTAFVMHLDENVVKKTIELRKKYKIKLLDAIIAATAMVSNLILITYNIADFKSKGLKLIDSHSLT